MFPAIAALVSLYGLFAKAFRDQRASSLLAGFLPRRNRHHPGADRPVIAGSEAKLGFGFIFGLAVALWSANAGMKAIMDALNVVYEEKEKRGFIKLNLSLSPLRSPPSFRSC